MSFPFAIHGENGLISVNSQGMALSLYFGHRVCLAATIPAILIKFDDTLSDLNLDEVVDLSH